MADHTTSEPTVGSEAALTGQYEQLRQVALAGHAEGWRHGLGVLTARGMTGWIHACQTIPPPPAPTASGRGLSVRAARSASTFGSFLPRRATSTPSSTRCK